MVGHQAANGHQHQHFQYEDDSTARLVAQRPPKGPALTGRRPPEEDCRPNDHVHEREDREEEAREEGRVIVAADAGVEVGAVMVDPVDTVVALVKCR